jgi:NAD(P)H-nitrite reductase large subunit
MCNEIDDDVLVCRCEEITLGEIRQAIRMGAVDITGVKRRTRAGMGLCQGRTCEALVLQVLRAEIPNFSTEKAGISTPQTPQRPISFQVLGGSDI